MDKAELESILWQAVNSPRGLLIKTSDREAFKRRVYAYIGKAKEQGIEAFSNLALKRSPTDSQAILLIKKEALPNAKAK